jgi:hypothetical protein
MTRRRPSNQTCRAWMAYLNSRRPTGDTLKAKLARASQEKEGRPKPTLPRVRWLELPLFPEDDEGGQS